MKRLQSLIKKYFDLLYLDVREQRRSALKLLMEANPAALILDCGCREGNDSLEFTAKVRSKRIIGLDYNWSALSQTGQKGIAPVQADLNDSIPLHSNSIDVILASNVIEHLVNPQVFVEEMYRVLRPGGYVVLNTPNLASWHNVFALVLGVQPFSGPNVTTMVDADLDLVREMHRTTPGLLERAQPDENSHVMDRHILVLAFVSLIRLFEHSGFQMEYVRGFGYYPLPGFAARSFQRLDPRHTHHLVLKARKK